MANEQRVSPQVEDRSDTEGEVGTLGGIMSPPEIEVDRVIDTHRPAPQGQGPKMYVIRVNQDIDEMSHVAGGRREVYTFETGHQYRVPWYIAQELENTGKLWH